MCRNAMHGTVKFRVSLFSSKPFMSLKDVTEIGVAFSITSVDFYEDPTKTNEIHLLYMDVKLEIL